MQSVLRLLGRIGFWRAVGRVHRQVYRLSRGRLGATLQGIPHLLLTTTGRRSGQARTVPLSYLRDGESYVLIASNGGSDRPPAWWLNLMKSPRARIQVGRECFEALASEARGEERARLWPRVTALNSVYSHYERMTDRQIPLVVLRSESSAGVASDAPGE